MMHRFTHSVTSPSQSGSLQSIGVMWRVKTCCVLFCFDSDIQINVLDAHSTWLLCCYEESQSAGPSCYSLRTAQKCKKHSESPNSVNLVHQLGFFFSLSPVQLHFNGFKRVVLICLRMLRDGEKRKVKHTEKEVKLFLIHKINVG